MLQDEYFNIGNKKNELDSKVLNIESMLTKIDDVLNVSKFRDELETIKDKVSYNTTEYDYNVCIQELDTLDKNINKIALPFYEIYLLTSKIEKKLKDVLNEDIDEIIIDTKKLIDILISVSNYKNRDVSYLFDKSYRIIYKVIINEEIFNRCDILKYINDLNIIYIKENVGKLFLDDINHMNQREDNTDDFSNEFIEEELSNIKDVGLGYDYLNYDFVKKFSRRLIGNKYIEYESKKNCDISSISSRINSFTRRNDDLISKFNEQDIKIKNLYIRKSLLISKAISIILIPFVTFSLGRMIGKKSSDKITEFKTITRTVDLDTKEIVGDIDYVYDEVETTYVATIMECEPWRKNPSGIGYIRNVTAYECIVPKEIDEGYHITKDDLENKLIEKYSYIESKENLDKDDSTTQTTILLTETYQDKNDTRKSTKYIIPFSIVGILAGIGIDVLLVFLGLYDLDRIREIFDGLDRDIKNSKLDKQETSERLMAMTENKLVLEEEYSRMVKKYGEFEIKDTETIQEKTPSKVVNVKTRTKRKY